VSGQNASFQIAEQRARAHGIRNVKLRLAGVEPDQTPGSGSRFPYDAALCRWALMFFADLPAVLRGIRRSLAPGGWLAASTVGGWPDRYPLVATVVGAICEALKLPPPPALPACQPGFFSLSDPAVLHAALADAGFVDVRVEWLPLTYEFASAQQVADWQFAISAPVNVLLAQRPEGRAKARRAVAAAAERFRTGDGVIRFSALRELVRRRQQPWLRWRRPWLARPR
jgi:hypothetical protein